MLDFNKKNNFTQIFIVFLTSFILGVFTTYNLKEYLPEKPSLIKDFDIKNTEKNKEDIVEKYKNDLNLYNFWKVYSLIKENYYDQSSLKKDDIISGAIKGMVDSMKDKHSEYMTKEETESFNEVLSGDFEGIGAVVEKKDSGIVVGNVLKGSPASKYGVKNGDVILKVNNEEIKDLTLADAVKKIKGPAKTEVLLNIFRVGEKGLLNIKVIRDKIKIPSVDYKIFEKENIGYIAINIFGNTTSQDFKNALKETEKADGLIIDLRDNGGGYLNSAVEILSNFIKDGDIVVKTKYKNILDNQTYRSINEGKIYNKKIVILINENSASASEITAGALRDYDKAILVGDKSYGKGSVQEPFTLEDGSMVKLTIAKWFTPKDRPIDKVGITPDITVKFKEEDFSKKYDRQLEEAKKILKNFIKFQALQLSVDKYNKK